MRLLESRIRSVPSQLARASSPVLRDLGLLERWVVTGVGGSELPARLLTHLLCAASFQAQFAALSSFVEDPDEPLSAAVANADALVVFSQSLSPNAQIPLRHVERYRRVFLVTSLRPDDVRIAALIARGVTIVEHGPPHEEGLLVRVIGPLLASTAALSLALAACASAGRALPAWATETSQIAKASELASEQATCLTHVLVQNGARKPLALLVTGDEAEWLAPLALRIVESLGMSHVPVWDTLGFAHGPLQATYDTPCILLALDSGRNCAILDRVARVLAPERHTLIRISATLPAPLSMFECAAAIDALTLSSLQQLPRSLAVWPGQGCDKPLYQFNGETNS
jgi:hypothetical protein